MKLVDILSESPWLPPASKISRNKKSQKLRKLFRTRGRSVHKRLRDIAAKRDRKWVPDVDPMDYLDGHTDNGPKFT